MLKYSVIFFAFVAIIGCQSVPDVDQPVKSVKKYSAKQFFETVNYRGASFSADEKSLLVTHNKTGIYNVYQMDFATGQQKPLTQSKKHTTMGVSYFPKDNRFLFTRDHNGDELNHLYVMSPKGKAKDLTPGKKLKAFFMGWSGDEKHFYVATNGRDAKFFDVYAFDTNTYKKKMVYKNTLGVMPGAISDDGRWISLNKTNSNVDSDLYILDISKKDAQPIVLGAQESAVQYGAYTFTPDSKKLIYSSNKDGEFTQAYQYDLETAKTSSYYSADWDIMFIGFSEKGRYREIYINQDAQTKLQITDLKTGEALEFPSLKGNVSSASFSPSETKLAFYLNSDTSPSNLYTTSVNEMKPKKLTDSLNPEISESDMVQGHVVRYKSFDGTKIPSILYRPWQASADRPVPGVVFVHGGPGGQSRKGYSAAIQHLVNHGYAVLAVNNRGSSGYGKTFYHMDDKKHGKDDLQDCIYGRRYLEKLDWVNGDQVAIMGGSYGGYMVAAALTFAPEAFDVGINIFGVTNWLRTLKSIPPWWASMKQYLYDEIGDPSKEEEALRAKSPLFHAQNIKRPFLVVQGKNDPRVLKAESDEIVAAAKKNNVPVEYLLFDDEGHGFTKTKNRIEASEKYLNFLNAHLNPTSKKI